MIPRRLEEITEDDLLALISNGVSEGRTVDYKRELPGNSDGDKKEFLADASSFANTAGGDLVFGMDEDQGLPTKVAGIQVGDADLAIRRLESILAAGLNPRIKYAMRVVNTRDGQKALVIRVDRSWLGPHRVVFQGHDKFYGRNSAGKYPLDVNELRASFTLSSTVTERIRAFRTDRLIALVDNQTPIPFVDAPKVVLHCIPLESFSGQTQYDVLPFQKNPMRLRPMETDNWGRRLNLDGVIAFETSQPSRAYTQLYRSGVIEAVQGRILAVPHQGRLVIPGAWYEKVVLEYLTYCFGLLQELAARGGNGLFRHAEESLV